MYKPLQARTWQRRWSHNGRLTIFHIFSRTWTNTSGPDLFHRRLPKHWPESDDETLHLKLIFYFSSLSLTFSFFLPSCECLCAHVVFDTSFVVVCQCFVQFESLPKLLYFLSFCNGVYVSCFVRVFPWQRFIIFGCLYVGSYLLQAFVQQYNLFSFSSSALIQSSLSKLPSHCSTQMLKCHSFSISLCKSVDVFFGVKRDQIWRNFDRLFLFWQNNKPTLANLLHLWANLHCCKWPYIGK